VPCHRRCGGECLAIVRLEVLLNPDSESSSPSSNPRFLFRSSP
jgi:hypothetical protein